MNDNWCVCAGVHAHLRCRWMCASDVDERCTLVVITDTMYTSRLVNGILYDDCRRISWSLADSIYVTFKSNILNH